MDLLDMRKIVDDFLAFQGWRFRYLDRKWWIFEDGYWSMFQGRDRLSYAIMMYTREMGGDPKILKQVGQIHVLTKLCGMLAPKLFVDRLPGRREEPTEPS